MNVLHQNLRGNKVNHHLICSDVQFLCFIYRWKAMRVSTKSSQVPGTASGWGGGGGVKLAKAHGKIGSASTQAVTSSGETSPQRICD